MTSLEHADGSVSPGRRRSAVDRLPTPLDLAFREHAAAVHRVARRVAGGNLAADVTQEVFLRLVAHPERYDPERGGLRTYLCTVARGVAIDFARQEHARRARDIHGSPGIANVEPDPESAAIRLDDARRVAAALDELHPREREAIVHAYGHDATYRQTADRLLVPEGTVKSRIRVGLVKLRAGLDDR